MGYLDLAKDGPILIEVPPGLQDILDDFFQRPICGPQAEGHTWCGDVGLPGRTRGRAASISWSLRVYKARSLMAIPLRTETGGRSS
nr:MULTISPECIES: hypothetical protein [unclassified Caballeronia]